MEADAAPREAAETAISLQDAARRLGVSYQTVWQRRGDIAFRLPGSRIWRVWPSRLASLSERQYKVTRLTLRSDMEKSCRSDNAAILGGSISARQAASELDDLLKPRTGAKRRNTTTG